MKKVFVLVIALFMLSAFVPASFLTFALAENGESGYEQNINGAPEYAPPDTPPPTTPLPTVPPPDTATPEATQGDQDSPGNGAVIEDDTATPAAQAVGIILVPADVDHEWEFVSVDEETRIFRRIDGELHYFPADDDSELEIYSHRVSLKPADVLAPRQFQNYESYIFINIYEDPRPALCRLDDSGRLLARAVPIDSDSPFESFYVLIGREFLDINDEARVYALSQLPENQDPDLPEEDDQITQENKALLYDAIAWYELTARDRGRTLYIAVELGMDSDGEWIVRSAEEFEPDTIARIVVCVLLISIFAALALNIVITVLRGKK